jgi:transposase-like protein
MNIIEIYKRFPTEKDCILHLETVRWRGKPICPYCKSDRITPRPLEQRHHCNACNTTFSVTVATIFHHTHLDLQKWFLAVSLILNAKKGISSRQLARDIRVTKDTAWSMQMRVRDAMIEQGELFSGIIEMDETYIGGKPRKGNHRDDDPEGGNKSKRGRGTDKTPVVGMAERGGRVKAKVQDRTKLKFKDLRRIVRENVDFARSKLITDEYKGYSPFGKIIDHETINHQVAYAVGHIHTNTIEGFWALLKRGIVGQYHKVSIRYLNRYIDEFCYRYNNRKNVAVFDLTISRAVGVIA